jgi:hypothetical protein
MYNQELVRWLAVEDSGVDSKALPLDEEENDFLQTIVAFVGIESAPVGYLEDLITGMTARVE